MSKSQSRCKKGSNRCFFSRKCVKKNPIKRTKRCSIGSRQCANRTCYRKKMQTRSSRR